MSSGGGNTVGVLLSFQVWKEMISGVKTTEALWQYKLEKEAEAVLPEIGSDQTSRNTLG